MNLPCSCRTAQWVATLTLALPAVLAVPATAQQTGQITGLVTAAQSLQPLDGAQVLAEGIGIGALSDRRGCYLIPNVPAGTYSVRVTLIGYATAEQEVNGRGWRPPPFEAWALPSPARTGSRPYPRANTQEDA